MKDGLLGCVTPSDLKVANTRRRIRECDGIHHNLWIGALAGRCAAGIESTRPVTRGLYRRRRRARYRFRSRRARAGRCRARVDAITGRRDIICRLDKRDANANNQQDNTYDETWQSHALANRRHHIAVEGEAAAHEADQEQNPSQGCEQYGERCHLNLPGKAMRDLRRRTVCLAFVFTAAQPTLTIVISKQHAMAKHPSHNGLPCQGRPHYLAVVHRG